MIFKKLLSGMLLTVLLILLAGYLLVSISGLNLQFGDIAILTLCFSAINLLSLFIFSRGLKKDPENQMIHLMLAVFIKLPIEMGLALIWFFIAKKTGTSSLLLFFVLYLALTLFSIFYILKTLKNKPL